MSRNFPLGWEDRKSRNGIRTKMIFEGITVFRRKKHSASQSNLPNITADPPASEFSASYNEPPNGASGIVPSLYKRIFLYFRS